MERDLNQKFINAVIKMEPIQFVGLARFFGIAVFNDKDPAAQNVKDRFEARPVEEILEDMLKRFDKLNRTKKREVIQLVNKSNKSKR